jgi:macrolide transport system ATP-binding/permease protein
METLLKDLKYGARLLLRNPGFAAVAVFSLALGIGANTAIFSVVQQLVASPFPVEEPDRLVALATTDQRNPGSLPTSHLNFKDIRDQNTVFTHTAAFAFAPVNYLGEGGASEQILTQVTSGNYFDALGVRFRLGRGFLPEEDGPAGSGPVAVISHGFWERQFGGDPSVVGRTLSLNRHPFTIVGVAPQGFTGTILFGAPDAWVPMSMHDVVQPGFDWYEQRRGLFLFAFGRLKPGVSLSEAQANLSAIGSQLAADYPNDNQGRSFGAVPLADARINPQGNGGGPVVQASLLLMVIVGVVLLIACANIANLLLARATARAREIAVRLALGAARPRLIRQLLTESLLLSLLGGAVGLLIGYWTLDLIRAAPIQLPPNFLQQIAIDGRVLAFTLALAVGTGLLFGLVPALSASRPSLVPTLKNETTPVVAGARGRFRWVSLRQALVVAQVALSLIALVAAGLFLRSLQETQRIDPGFETNRVFALSFNLGREGYTPERGLQFHERLLERAAALPGALSASVAQNRPFQGGFARSVLLEGSEAAEQNRTLVQVNTVTPGYFQTVGISLMRGRDFTPQDTADTPLVVVVNETMADRYFGGADAIGRRFRFFGDTADTTIIGVARDAKYNGLVEDAQPFAYQPMTQAYNPAANLLVRARGDASGLAAEARVLMQQLDPQIAILNVGTLQDQVDQALAPQRLIVSLLGVFGVLALLLAAIGLYGVASFSVTQRTREIGIRMALGASRQTVLRLVLLQGLMLVAVGIAVGVLAAWLLAQGVSGLLVGVRPADPLTFAMTAAVLFAVAALASYVPARRATRIDPLLALRHE